MIVNWPQGVVRDRDKGMSGLSAEDVDKLHDAIFVDERRIRFVPCGESDRSTAGKQARFRVTTAEAYPHKKRRV